GPVGEEFASINVSEDLDGSTVDCHSTSGRQVPSKTIDQLVSERSLAGPFILKFDTHGFEEKILEGAVETLRLTDAIIMECYNFNITSSSLRFPQMCVALEDLGFRPMDLADPMLRPFDGVLWQFDLLFMRSESPIFKNNHYRTN
ncbi:MAG: FkbM family methyltransferase, partial [Haliea sp.]